MRGLRILCGVVAASSNQASALEYALAVQTGYENRMSLDGKSDTEIASLEEQLLLKLREFGGFSGNVKLQRALGWDEPQYWAVRNRIYDRGLLVLGRGRGGSVTLVEKAAALPVNEQEVEQPVDTAQETEISLYAPIAEVLRQNWVKDYRLRQSWVEITALQGRRQTGGTWTRPDLIVAGVRIFPHLPNKYFDLFSFEVKPSWAVSVTAVYEALAHRRAATHAYVWFHVPDEKATILSETVDVIASEAKRFGIGVIIAAKAEDYESWDVLVEATRVEPDPEGMNDFISVQLSAAAKDEIVAWVR